MNKKCCQFISSGCSSIPLARLIRHFHPDDSVRLRSLNTDGQKEPLAQLNSFRIKTLGEFRWIDTLTVGGVIRDGKMMGNLNLILTERMRNSGEIVGHTSAKNSPPTNLDSSKLIIGELQHRLRNILMVVSSIAENTARNADSLDEFLSCFTGKLKTLIRSQEQICYDRPGSITFADLASNEVGHLLSEPSLVSIEGPVIYIRKGLIPIFQLILYELTMNSLKYGAAKSLRGSITLSCSHLHDPQMEPGVEFRWSETWNRSTESKTISQGESSGGDGMRLLKTLITQYCRGTLNVMLEDQRLVVSWYLSEKKLGRL